VLLDIEKSSNVKGRPSKNMKGGGRQTKIYDLVNLSKLKEPIRSQGTKKSVGIMSVSIGDHSQPVRGRNTLSTLFIRMQL
jgi:hypothetical protein